MRTKLYVDVVNGSVTISDEEYELLYIPANKVKKLIKNVELDPEALEETAVLWAENEGLL